MKKKLRFPKGIKTLRLPLLPELGGESQKELQRIFDEYELPKNVTVSFTRQICTTKGLEFDITEITISR